MLRSYTNQDDIVIGTPVANRHYHQTQYLIGFFVNTVALRINIHNSSKLTDFIYIRRSSDRSSNTSRSAF